ncbi:MAG: glycosyltransferase [Candidatus Obscuribacterales bacterium]
MAPRVSVLLPVYNGSRYLPEAIESVLAQSTPDWELLIGDDCSDDDSWTVISRYAKQDSRINAWVNDSNKGLFANYNRCLESATGAFIKPFAQDDKLEPSMLERMLARFEQSPDVTLISTAKQWIDKNGSVTKTLHPFPSSRKISGREVVLYNLLRWTNWVGEPSTVMFRADRTGSGFDTQFFHYGDIEYWFRILMDAQYFYIDEVLCSFRRHEESSTSKNLSQLLFALDILALGKKYRGFLEDFGESSEQIYARACETIALELNHLIKDEGITLPQILEMPVYADARMLAQGYKELAYRTLRYLTDVLAQFDDLRCRTRGERELLEAQLSDMRNSTSWKITAPLRSMRGAREQ